MKKLVLVLLCLACLAGLAPAHAAEPEAAQPAVSPSEAPLFCEQGATAQAPAGGDLFVPKPLEMDPPTCNPFCIYSQCSKSSECTLMPNGRCVLSCPQLGCCVY